MYVASPSGMTSAIIPFLAHSCFSLAGHGGKETKTLLPQCRQVRQECSPLQEVDALKAASLIAVGSHVSVAPENIIREGFLYLREHGTTGTTWAGSPHLPSASDPEGGFLQQVVCFPFESVSRKQMHPTASTGCTCGKKLSFFTCVNRASAVESASQ
jgi:hypothetical protein